ncbi:MAG: right-handed parallel beta-helix repeat-containing protein [Treponema sp.]|jgi:hypothetical protein|nr:right-handed parallel beta-helix repeat-containing protein [Treponema sp.]
MKKFLVWSLAAFLVAACTLDIGDLELSKSNRSINFDAYVKVGQEEFLGSLNPLVFGTSTGGGNRIAVGPYTGSFTPNGGNSFDFDVPEGYINLQATSNGGKIAGSEDGITFLFREVDTSKNFKISAEFTVKGFGAGARGDGGAGDPTVTSNGQEGWGLMVRDFVPQYPGTNMAAIRAKYPSLGQEINGKTDFRAGSTGGDSNMIMVGGVKRGVRVYWRQGTKAGVENEYDETGNPLTTLYMDSSRTKFDYTPKELPDYSMYDALGARPDFPSWGSVYRLTLEKTNNDFKAIIEPPPDKGGAVTYSVPLYDILDGVNKNKYYVGFFAARDACVNVTNIEYFEANTEDCAPYVEPKPILYTPSLELLSPEIWGGTDYLYVKSNVAGGLAVTMNGREIPGQSITGEWMSEPTNGSAVPFNLFTVPTYPHIEGENVFTIMFYPNVTQSVLGEGYGIDSIAPIRKTFTVTKQAIQGGTGDIYVSPSGRQRNSGAPGSPLDLETALKYVFPGQKIVMQDGIYSPVSVNIPRYNNGKYGSVKTLEAEHRNKAIIDFGKNRDSKGFILAGNYWKIDGIHVRNTPDKVKGLTVMGKNNVVSYVKTYSNGDTGLQISGQNAEAKRLWPSGNTIEYCESYDNKDAATADADGFAAKLTVGDDNVFSWCVAHHNCDDGWDLFSKKETGAIGAVKLDHCISYMNGATMAGFISGDGNGFKMGGEGIPVLHEIRESLSFMEKSANITSNSNPALMVYNCTAYKTGGGTINIYSGDKSDPTGKVIDSVSSGAAGSYVGSNVDWEALLGSDPEGYFDVDALNDANSQEGFKAGFIRRDVFGKFILKDGNNNPVLKPTSNGAQELYQN